MLMFTAATHRARSSTVRLRLSYVLTCTLFLAFATASQAQEQPMEKADPLSGESSPRAEVLAFVTSEHFHGVPYEQAHQLGPESLPVLEELLAGEIYAQHWTNVVATIAFIDAPRSFDVLLDFLEMRFTGSVDAHTFSALTNVPSVMGTVHDSRVIGYLIRGSEPAYWTKLNWTHVGYSDAKRASLLSRLCLSGLSFTGSAQARAHFVKLSTLPASDRERRNLAENMSRNDAIAAEGLIPWARRMNAKH